MVLRGSVWTGNELNVERIDGFILESAIVGMAKVVSTGQSYWRKNGRAAGILCGVPAVHMVGVPARRCTPR